MRGNSQVPILLSQHPPGERLRQDSLADNLDASMDSLRAADQKVAASPGPGGIIDGSRGDSPASGGIDSPVFQTLDRTAGFPYSPGEYARRALWQIVQAALIRPSP